MDLSVDEIRTLLGMCVRGLRHFREHDKHLGSAERANVHNIEIRVEEAYDDLYPFAPDIGEPPNDNEEEEKGRTTATTPPHKRPKEIKARKG